MKLHLDKEAFRVLIDTIHTQKGTQFTPLKCGIISTVTASLNNISQHSNIKYTTKIT